MTARSSRLEPFMRFAVGVESVRAIGGCHRSTQPRGVGFTHPDDRVHPGGIRFNKRSIIASGAERRSNGKNDHPPRILCRIADRNDPCFLLLAFCWLGRIVFSCSRPECEEGR